MIHHLNRSGRMGMVLANGALSSQTNNEGEIRAKIVDADLVEGIIAMPDKLFYSTGIPVSLWIITKNKKQSGKTLFIDARDMGTWCPAGFASSLMRTSPRYRLRSTRSVTALWKRRRASPPLPRRKISSAGLHPDSGPLRRCRRSGRRR